MRKFKAYTRLLCDNTCFISVSLRNNVVGEVRPVGSLAPSEWLLHKKIPRSSACGTRILGTSEQFA
jgi:hypothetical protein